MMPSGWTRCPTAASTTACWTTSLISTDAEKEETMSAARSAQSVEQARRGVLLAEHRVTDGTADLDGGMRLQVLDILIAALEGSYAHLVAKRAAYASNPVQALTLLRRRSSDLSDAEFHRAVSTIMT